jgi:hypothetical protein
MTPIATQTLPEGSHSGYVAAAYIFFLVLVLVYVAIMAWRLTRVERAVRELGARRHEGAPEPREGAPDGREREIV